ncbi:Abi family protein [Microbacterium sp. NPDC076768]|uniref:Abi family protein n=1 Tax=Microbacterium sp. NPDC076768 TaxID=3154858 RepID=UPI0034301DEE
MEPKPHSTYSEQIELLRDSGMLVDDEAAALALLRRVGYYTLSGYSYPFRFRDAVGVRTGRFYPGTSLPQVEALWAFDNRLRLATLGPLQHVETYLRALLGYKLGEVDPMVHRKRELLSLDRPSDYPKWIQKLDGQLRDSREEFIVHHREKRESVVPVWVAVDVLDWGGLSYLYTFAPLKVRDDIAATFELSAAQLKSWMRALNVVRNVCAHHSRLFNRHYSLTPKLPRLGQHPSLDAINEVKDSTFAMLTLLQHLASHTDGVNMRILPAVMSSFPATSGLETSATGAPAEWAQLELWRTP